MNNPRGDGFKSEPGWDHTFFFPANCDHISVLSTKNKMDNVSTCEAQVSCAFCTVKIDNDCMRCPVCASRQPHNIRRPIFSHRKMKKMSKWQINDDSDDDDVSDTCSADSSDSDDNKETDTESSDDEDDDERWGAPFELGRWFIWFRWWYHSS